MNNGDKTYEQDRQLANLARVKRVASFLFRTGLFLLVAVGVTMIVYYVIGAEYPMPIIFIAAVVMFACLFGGMIVSQALSFPIVLPPLAIVRLTAAPFLQASTCPKV